MKHLSILLLMFNSIKAIVEKDTRFYKEIYHKDDLDLLFSWKKVADRLTQEKNDVELKRISVYTAKINGKQFKFLLSVLNKQTGEIEVYTAVVQRKTTRVGYAFRVASIDCLEHRKITIHNEKYLAINEQISKWQLLRKSRSLNYILFVDFYEKVINDDVNIYMAVCRVSDTNKPSKFVIEEIEEAKYSQTSLTIVHVYEP